MGKSTSKYAYSIKKHYYWDRGKFWSLDLALNKLSKMKSPFISEKDIIKTQFDTDLGQGVKGHLNDFYWNLNFSQHSSKEWRWREATVKSNAMPT